jgi:hypothetical protein
MAKGLFPDEYVRSAYLVNYRKLYREGIRGIIYDIDNTLVLPDAHADNRTRRLFRYLHRIGLKAVLVSNNKEPRVKSFSEETGGTPYVYRAWKPLLKGYREAMELMGTDETNTVVIGDQLFTDIAGASMAGIRTILVKPMTYREEVQIVMKRAAEIPVLAAFHTLRKLRRK